MKWKLTLTFWITVLSSLPSTPLFADVAPANQGGRSENISQPASQPQATPQPPSLTATPTSAKAFGELWRAAIGRSSLPQVRQKLESFKAEIARDELLSDALRQLLLRVSVENNSEDLSRFLGDKPHAGIGVLHLLSLAAAISSSAKTVKDNTYSLMGKASRHFDYGPQQISYDGYLSDLHSSNSSFRKIHDIPQAPELNRHDLIKLRSFFDQTGDAEWEIRILRWQLATTGITGLVSTSAEPFWLRLAQLETGLSRELDLFLAQASDPDAAGVTNLTPPHLAPQDETKRNTSPAPTEVQCRQVVHSMLSMKMPWEAWMFLQHAKRKWRIELPDLQSKVKNNWDLEIRAGAKVWERNLNRPWFIGTVKVTPDLSLEEFITKFVERKKLP